MPTNNQRKPLKFYRVHDELQDEHPFTYHTSKDSARTHARQLANEKREPVDIELCIVGPPTKRLLVAIINGRGYVQNSKVIESVPPDGRRFRKAR